VKVFSSLFSLVVLLSISCAAQPAPTDLSTQIERQIRVEYNIPADIPVKIGPLSPSSEWPGHDAFTVTIGEGERKRDFPFLLARDHKSIVRMLKVDLSQDPYGDIMKKMELQGRPTRGAKSSKVTVVVYDDLQCPYCTMMHQSLFPQILKEYGDRVTFIYKDFPLPNHSWAIHAAVDANCLGAQNTDAFWSFVDQIHGNQNSINAEKTLDQRFAALDRIAAQQGTDYKLNPDNLQACIKAQDDKAVKASMNGAESLGVDGTPTLFVNGEIFPSGVVPLSRVRAALDRALKANGMVVPQPQAATPASPSN
jgi:protein-disulfide isomerase